MTASLANRTIQKPCSSLWKVWAKLTGNKCIFIQKASEYQPCDICNNGEKNHLIFYKCHHTRYLASNILPFRTPSSDSWAEKEAAAQVALVCTSLGLMVDELSQYINYWRDWLPNLSINMLPNHVPPWIKTHFNHCYRTG